MKQQQIDVIEEKFNRLKSGLTASQVKDPNYIIELSKAYEENDLGLSYRLTEHAYRLDNKSEATKVRLTHLRRSKKDLENKLSLEQIDEIIDKEEDSAPDSKEEKIVKENRFSKELIKLQVPKPIYLFVLFPWLIYAFYLTIIASPRFESHSQIIIKKPDNVSTMDPTMAMLSGFGVGSGSNDSELVKAYILSFDMLNYLEQNLLLKEHYASKEYDVFSRLSADSSEEEYVEYYNKRLGIHLDDASSILTINIQAYDPIYAQKLNKLIIDRAEWFINSIGQNLAKEQLAFINGEHELVVNKLQLAKRNLLEFQSENQLLDPEAEGAALQQIAYTLESNISIKKAELKSLELTMAENSPEILATQGMIIALENQLKEENERISGDYSADSVATKLAKFTDYKVDLELALQAYSSSLISLEKSRIEAYRKLQYLVTIESPTLPDDNQHPKVIYNLMLLAVVLLLIFGISKILIATVKELN